MLALAQVLWLALPVVIGGALHILAIRRDAFRALADVPLDAGLTVRRHRLFGDNKSVRGAVVMIGATTLATMLLALLARAVPALDTLALATMQADHPAAWGALLGAGYIVGELPNSFAKRQLGIPPGAAAPHRLRALFWVLDQVDSLAGILLVLSLVWDPTLEIVIGLVVLTLAVHPAMAAVMVGLGLKQRIG